MISLVCRYKTNQVIAERLIISPVWCRLVKHFTGFCCAPVWLSTLVLPLLVKGWLTTVWQLNIAFQGNKITKLFNLTSQNIIMKNCWILTTSKHTLSRKRERDVPGQEENNGYMEPIHITNPCRNFSDSFAIKSSLRKCSVVFSTEFSYNSYWYFNIIAAREPSLLSCKKSPPR